ncbi:MAG: glycosyl hydrolase 53 family protein, partial [Gemmatimonadota bacterium]
FVLVGIVVDAGFLGPVGHLGAASDTAAFTRFSRLLRAGIRGVRSATTATDSVRIIIHHSQGADPERTAWFFDRLGGLDYDIIGLSYYPWWHGDIRGLRATLAQAVTRHEKDVMVVETAYPWRRGPSWLEGSAAMAWPMTPDGQRAFLREVAAAVADAPEGRGQGVVWWDPESIVTPGIAPWADGVLALFDGAGRILPAADVFTDVNIGRRD